MVSFINITTTLRSFCFTVLSFITFSCSSLAFTFFLFPQLTVNNVKPMYHYLDVIVTGEIQKEKTDLKF